MIKLLHFSGPCSLAVFVASIGEGMLPSLKIIRCFDRGDVVCFLDTANLDDSERILLLESIRTAHSVEPVRLDHDVTMSEPLLDFLARALRTTS